MLVTGFGPFRNIVHNPSAVLAEQLSDQFRILSVTYPAAEAFAKNVRSIDADVVLCLGLNARLDEPAFELYAHNLIGAEPGSSGRKHTRTVIRKSGPKTLGQTLASPSQLLELPMKTSFTPGDYLCNFLLYSLLVRYPERRIGFVHIPLFEKMPQDEQIERLLKLSEFLD